MAEDNFNVNVETQPEQESICASIIISDIHSGTSAKYYA